MSFKVGDLVEIKNPDKHAYYLEHGVIIACRKTVPSNEILYVVSFDEDINLEVKYHNELQGLDYEEAGHTGFTPSRLSLLNNVGSDVTNQRLVVMANVDNVASKITANDLRKRMIRTESSIPNDLQVGQYLFLEKSNNQENVEGE